MSDKSEFISIFLIILGVILLVVVFVQGYNAYKTYSLEIKAPQGDTATILGISVQVLINLLVKIAFLGIALAAGSVILGKGVDLLKKCPPAEKSGE
ncbi:MAG: hypothetical protein F7C34_01155 [Desulfurococcales archaeon]|nr:hypothetical protein [Desulfurococcales archaeon]